jgi:tetratricopeptide (TPR) repeat protein
MDSEYTDQSFQQITQLLDQAETAYRRVLELQVDSAEYGVPVEDIARLGLGDVQVTLGIALQGYAQSDPTSEAFEQAVQIFNQAVETLNATLPAFQAPGLSRYLAQNYQILGIAYQSSGYLADLAGDPSAAMQAYRQAIEQFDACIALGEGSSDRIIKFDIVEGICLPLLQQTEERLQILHGGS